MGGKRVFPPFFVWVLLFLLVFSMLPTAPVRGGSPRSYWEEWSLTGHPTIINDVEVVDSRTIVVIDESWRIIAYRLSGGGLQKLWNTSGLANTWIRVGYAKCLDTLKLNTTSGEKTVVVAYERKSDSTADILFLDADSGSQVLPPVRGLGCCHTTLLTPAYATGNRVPILLVDSFDRTTLILYSTNGSYTVQHLAEARDDLSIYTDMSPRGSKLAIKTAYKNITVYDLTSSDINASALDIKLPAGVLYVHWVSDELLLVKVDESASINGTEYDVMYLLNFTNYPNYTTTIVFHNDMSVPKYSDTFVDDNGNLVMVVRTYDYSSKPRIGPPPLNPWKELWVFNPLGVTFINATAGVYDSPPVRLAFTSDRIALGPNLVYYRSPNGVLETLREYGITRNGSVPTIRFGSEYSFLTTRVVDTLALEARGDESVFLAVPDEDVYARGETIIGKLIPSTRSVKVIDRLPMEHPNGLGLLLYINSMTLSPDGRYLAVGGGFEASPLVYRTAARGTEKATLIVYNTASGQKVFEFNMTFTSSDLDKFNVFVPSITFLAPDTIAFTVEYLDYTVNAGRASKSLIVYNISSGSPVYSLAFTEPFVPSSLKGKSLLATAYSDSTGQAWKILILSSYQDVSTGSLVNGLKLRLVTLHWNGTASVKEAGLWNVTGAEHLGFHITGAVVSGSGLLYASVIDNKETSGGARVPDSFVLKISTQSGEIIARENLTGILTTVEAGEGVSREYIAGVIAGLRLVNDTLHAYVEKNGAGDPNANVLVLDSDLNILGNISLLQEDSAGNKKNLGLSYSYLTPTNNHFALDATGTSVYIVSSQGIHKFTLQQPRGGAPAPPSEGPQESNAAQTQPLPPPSQITPRKLETMKKFTEAMEVVTEVQKALQNMTLTIQPLQLQTGLRVQNLSQVREALAEAGIENAMKTLVENGLVKPVTAKHSKSSSEQLRKALEMLYGPLLERYPTAMGRIYLLYTLYYMQEDAGDG